MSYITFLFIFNGWQLVSDCDGCSHRRLCHTICSLLCFSLDKLLDRNNLAFPKDKLNSNWIYEGIVSSKMWTKKFERRISTLKVYKRVGKKSFKFLVCILGETMTSWIHSESNWPLGFKTAMKSLWIKNFTSAYFSLNTVFPHIVAAATILFWTHLSSEETIQVFIFLM